MESSRVQSYINAGLPKAKAEATAKKDDKVASVLDQIISNAAISDASKNPKQGNLLLHLATTAQELPVEDLTMLAKLVHEGSIQSLDQLNGGISHLKAGGDRSKEAVEKASGVGIIVTAEQVAAHVKDYMTKTASTLSETTWANLSSAMASLKLVEDLRWASPLTIKQQLESAFTESFGSKEEYNKANAAASKSAKGAAKAKAPAAANGEKKSDSAVASTSAAPVSNMFEEGFLAALHPVGGNPQIHEYLREQHLKATGGLVHTRFPPEPNGYLHIGHSKAIAVNFGYAQYHKGHCYLRYDDTNPEAEEQVYIDSILDIVRWLGYEPWKITYSSDHFQRLYELAVELIKRDKAYMCHCTAEEIHENRGGADHGPRKACVHRTRPIAESLEAFEKMKLGQYKPDEFAVLRMKQDLNDGNPQMWDLIAYRTLKKPHHRTGNEWCIYPTYDFTHCLCDSFENITHSLCTTEFIQSRVSYEWLCDALEIYKPRQSEYGRLKLQGTFLSKRKIMKLVDTGIVKGWDDPRLYTLIALRRRGIPPGAILSFVNGLGVTTATTTITTVRFEQAVRAYLEMNTPRLMFVLKPLKLTLENVPEDYVETIEKPLHTKNASMGSNKIPLTKHLYIDASDFRTVDSKDFFRLAPGKTVGLLYASYPVTCTSYKTDEKTGEVTEVFARYEGFSTNPAEAKPAPKVKTYIHWVAEHAPSKSPIQVSETRIFKQLFKSDDPSALKDYIADVDPDSLQVVKGAMIEVGIWDIIDSVKKSEKKGAQEQKEITQDPSEALSGGVGGGNERVRFQGLRTAYFCIDSEAKVKALDEDGHKGPSQGDELILNWTVSLKEDKTK